MIMIQKTCKGGSRTVTSWDVLMLNMSPYTPALYSKIGVYRGIHYFLIFTLKHRLLVSEAVLTCTHNLCFEQN